MHRCHQGQWIATESTTQRVNWWLRNGHGIQPRVPETQPSNLVSFSKKSPHIPAYPLCWLFSSNILYSLIKIMDTSGHIYEKVSLFSIHVYTPPFSLTMYTWKCLAMIMLMIHCWVIKVHFKCHSLWSIPKLIPVDNWSCITPPTHTYRLCGIKPWSACNWKTNRMITSIHWSKHESTTRLILSVDENMFLGHFLYSIAFSFYILATHAW